eukprot:TRINITY_DN6534_c0_g1_i1.p1 TRINITY_DN6534_c0_g1~~TRINITY_DN6534_c0_g1_i1.p1  ORF type:complete len:625 (+),score=128.72 TRINITY_DN6534_c0_g1_i1:57-1931(+)
MADPPYPSGDAKALWQEGSAAFAAGRLDAAARLYTKALKGRPSDARLLSNRSAVHLAAGKAEKAMDDAQATLSAAPRWYKGYIRMGMALRFMGRHRDAVEKLEAAKEHAPRDEAVEREVATLLRCTEMEEMANYALLRIDSPRASPARSRAGSPSGSPPAAGAGAGAGDYYARLRSRSRSASPRPARPVAPPVLCSDAPAALSPNVRRLTDTNGQTFTTYFTSPSVARYSEAPERAEPPQPAPPAPLIGAGSDEALEAQPATAEMVEPASPGAPVSEGDGVGEASSPSSPASQKAHSEGWKGGSGRGTPASDGDVSAAASAVTPEVASSTPSPLPPADVDEAAPKPTPLGAVTCLVAAVALVTPPLLVASMCEHAAMHTKAGAGLVAVGACWAALLPAGLPTASSPCAAGAWLQRCTAACVSLAALGCVLTAENAVAPTHAAQRCEVADGLLLAAHLLSTLSAIRTLCHVDVRATPAQLRTVSRRLAPGLLVHIALVTCKVYTWCLSLQAAPGRVPLVNPALAPAVALLCVVLLAHAMRSLDAAVSGRASTSARGDSGVAPLNLAPQDWFWISVVGTLVASNAAALSNAPTCSSPTPPASAGASGPAAADAPPLLSAMLGAFGR